MRAGDTGSSGWIACVIPALEHREGSVRMDCVCLHADVHVLHVLIINSALGDTCSLGRPEHGGQME